MYLKSNPPLKDLAYKRTDATVPLIFQIKQENLASVFLLIISAKRFYQTEFLLYI